jgi:diadenosine tetraphosphate (Ap4A) HIT family hydrolase
VCAILAGARPHHEVYEDADTIAFLARPVTLLGYCIVAHKRHIEDWVREMGEDEFLALQRVVHRVSRAVTDVAPTERMYNLSLGSKQGNAHLHWHVAPLSPGCALRQPAALRAHDGKRRPGGGRQFAGSSRSGNQESPVFAIATTRQDY